MRQSSNTTRPVSGAGQAFCGLGFDLEQVTCAAQGMTIQWAGKPLEDAPMLVSASFVPRTAGYDLLVSLGREIRGQ